MIRITLRKAFLSFGFLSWVTNEPVTHTFLSNLKADCRNSNKKMETEKSITVSMFTYWFPGTYDKCNTIITNIYTGNPSGDPHQKIYHSLN